MAESLSYEAIKEMKFADYKKAFKEKSQWRKAKALIILVDYKLGSRKAPIVLPLRRSNQLKPLLQQIKADKHPTQKMAAGLLDIRKGDKGSEMTFQKTHGGCTLETIEGRVKPLVKQILKCGFVAEQGELAPEEETNLENQEETTIPRGESSNSTVEGNSPESTASTVDIKKVLQAIKPLALRVHKEVTAAIKQKTYGEQEAALLEELEGLIKQFDEFYQKAAPKQQQQLAPHQNNVDQKIRPLLEKLQAAAEKLTTDDNSNHDKPEPEDRAEQAPQEENHSQQEKEAITGESPEEQEEESTLEFNTPEEVEDFLTTAKAEMQQLLDSLGIS